MYSIDSPRAAVKHLVGIADNDVIKGLDNAGCPCYDLDRTTGIRLPGSRRKTTFQGGTSSVMAEIVRWSPFGELASMRRAMDHLFEEGRTRPWRILTWESGNGFFPLDLYETDEEVVVKASMPGVKPEELDISITGDVLTVKGEAREEEEEKRHDYYRRERRRGTFARSVTLPVQVESEKVEAVFEHGVLTLRMPKAEAVRSKTIKVQAK
jgi:HSP20 family protein